MREHFRPEQVAATEILREIPTTPVRADTRTNPRFEHDRPYETYDQMATTLLDTKYLDKTSIRDGPIRPRTSRISAHRYGNSVPLKRLKMSEPLAATPSTPHPHDISLRNRALFPRIIILQPRITSLNHSQARLFAASDSYQMHTILTILAHSCCTEHRNPVRRFITNHNI